jgi:hypothetical protein
MTILYISAGLRRNGCSDLFDNRLGVGNGTNRCGEVGFSLVNLEVFMAKHQCQQLVHGISDQTFGFLFDLGIWVLRITVDCHRFILCFRNPDREYPKFGIHLLESRTRLAVTFRGVVPPSPERERNIRVSENSQVDTEIEAERMTVTKLTWLLCMRHERRYRPDR